MKSAFMATALPKSISVGGKRIAIKVNNQIDDYGQYHHDAGCIHIGKAALEDEKTTLETIRHELVHAALNISGIAFSKKLEEEVFVRCMDSIFFPAWERFLARYQANKQKTQ